MGDPISKDEMSESGYYQYYQSGDDVVRTNTPPSMTDTLKFITPYSRSYKGCFFDRAYVGMFNAYCNILTKEEGEHLRNLLLHPMIRLFADNYKKTYFYYPYNSTTGFNVAVKLSLIHI